MGKLGFFPRPLVTQWKIDGVFINPNGNTLSWKASYFVTNVVVSRYVSSNWVHQCAEERYRVVISILPSISLKIFLVFYIGHRSVSDKCTIFDKNPGFQLFLEATTRENDEIGDERTNIPASSISVIYFSMIWLFFAAIVCDCEILRHLQVIWKWCLVETFPPTRLLRTQWICLMSKIHPRSLSVSFVLHALANLWSIFDSSAGGALYFFHQRYDKWLFVLQIRCSWPIWQILRCCEVFIFSRIHFDIDSFRIQAYSSSHRLIANHELQKPATEVQCRLKSTQIGQRNKCII